jgi:two-component system phosphate regulon sensor histidine kinase PhoR
MMLMHIKNPFSHPHESLEHQQFTSLVNSMADAVLALDQEAKVVLYNAAALGILDLNTIPQNASMADIFKPIGKDNQPIDVVKMIKETAVPVINRDMRLKYGGDNLINLYLSIAPVHQGYGKHGQTGYVLMIRDITHEKSLEEEREEFISVVSHELRTPIAVTEGNISNAQVIVDKGGDTETVQKALTEAHDQIVYLSDMINDLATLSRAERGKLDIEITDINVKQLISDLLASYTPAAQAKGLALMARADTGIPDLKSSELYVKEILQNFITNSIKYTADGTITVTAKAAAKGITFSVQDSGIGISKSDQEKIFDKFFRSEDFHTRQANGTGLGLYITMKLASRLNAIIDVQSEPGKGSTFTIDIPNLASEIPAEAAEPVPEATTPAPAEEAPAAAPAPEQPPAEASPAEAKTESPA